MPVSLDRCEKRVSYTTERCALRAGHEGTCSTRDKPPSYHDLYVTTAEIPRTSIFNLPFDLEVSCTRVGGWQLWKMPTDGPRGAARQLAGEYDDNGLRLDVDGEVIVDSLTEKLTSGGDDPG